MDIRIYDSKESLGSAAAAHVAGLIRQAILEREQARVIFATGASQYEFLAAVVREYPDLDWSRVTAFHLDEYLNLPVDHPASFRRYLQERLFGLLPFRRVHLLDGTAPDPQAEAARYEALLHLGPIDVACIGIGENAHLAFNDPPADFNTRKWVHIVQLDEACRRQQVGEGHFATMSDVPERALSLSIPAILAARTISCVAPEARKAAAVQCALKGPVTPQCPASALQLHGRVTVFLDQESAAGLNA